MAEIRLEGVTKEFGNVMAVDNIDLTVRDREFVAIVGPSGCGKTTILRMIAGLEELSAGNIYIEDRLVNDVPAKDRHIAMVFQNYALYPQMNVYRNISFGLRIRKFKKAEIDRRVQEAAHILDIEDLLDRKPKALSGGQRQRVAMGRAIVRHPKVFLFDEPLSNLDAKLRVQMRGELGKLRERLQTTMVYVTHDQVEAMTLADRVVIMNKGRIIQIGTPLDAYNHPQHQFVAGFIGSPTMNFFEGCVIAEDNRLFLKGDAYRLVLPPEKQTQYEHLRDQTVVWGVRPQSIYDRRLKGDFPGGERLQVVVEVVEPLGPEVVVLTACGKDRLTASLDPNTAAQLHANMELLVDMNRIHVFDPKTGNTY